jgi:hypothetical protein
MTNKPCQACQYCGALFDGVNWDPESREHGWHSEVVTTNDPELGSREEWFCCHKCRDAGEPCETFYPEDYSWSQK